MKIYIIFLLAFLCIGCEMQFSSHKEYYDKYKLDVNCGDKFKGIVYEQARNTPVYVVFYKLENGNRIDLPIEGCVKIRLEEYDEPRI